MRIEGKLMNGDGEFIASGPCEINRDRSEVTMWPSFERNTLQRERGTLTLELEDGTSHLISDKHLTFKLRGDAEHRISVYRLRIIEKVPEHMAAGYSERRPAVASDVPAENGPVEEGVRVISAPQ